MNMRVRPGDRRAVGLFTWLLAKASGVVTGTVPPRLFLVLGKHRWLFHGWLFFAARLMPGGLLPRRETELVILRVAHLRGSEYEFEQHRRLGRRAGVHSRDIERLLADSAAAGFNDRECVLLTAADQLVGGRDLDDATWSALRTHLSEREVIELCLLVGHYDMLATVINTLRIPPDRPRR